MNLISPYKIIRRAGLLCLPILISMNTGAQQIRAFQMDTATFVLELRTFSADRLQENEVPDFERFIRLWDSLPYDREMEIISLSNLMLDRNCSLRPQFILFQKVMLEFWNEGKTSHGYNEWVEGYRHFLASDRAVLQAITHFLETTYLLFTENALVKNNSLLWKVAGPLFTISPADGTVHFIFNDVTVTCYLGRDYIQILDASGFFDPLTLTWTGEKGTVTWERTGIPLEELHVQLGQYQIDLKKSGYQADSVIMVYPAYFEGEVLGRMEDKVTQIKDIRQVKYPQFFSYQSSYRIDQIAPGVNFQGGLYIEGSNLAGFKADDKQAILDFYSEDTLRMKIRSDLLLLNERNITSQNSTVTIYIGTDSIYHPDLVLNYDIAREEARLSKSDRFTSQGPYLNSYHNLDMNFDELFWKRNEAKLKLQALTGSSIGRATFESNTFFNYDFYASLQGMDYEHPLVELWAFSEYVQGRKFSVTAFASYIGYAVYQVRHQLMSLSKLGFVYFDDEQDMVTLRQKLFDYIQSSMGQRDYDVIRFISRTESNIENAELDIHSRDLTINGIPAIFLSDSQNVRLIPEANRIIIKRDRNFQFDGIIDAGLFRFFGKNFFFHYDDFKINLQNIDSLQLSVRSNRYNHYGEEQFIRIDNKIELMTGELLIDEPDNKSGLKNFPRYPTFTSKENSFVFFDESSIQNGVYKRDNFYFELDSFMIDSLDNYRRDAVRLKGTFVSANILPPIDMQMTLRDDNSLGFYMVTPEEGISIYGDRGRFYNDIEMSSKGLHGYGSLDYLTSTTWSDDFIMHPDSIFTRSREFLVREQSSGTEFPHARNTVADMTWYPEADEMKIRRVKESFHIFNDSIVLAGDLSLKPDGLRGSGAMALPEARLESDLFSYNYQAIFADSAGIQLKAQEDREFSVQTNDVRLHIDFEERKGDIRANRDYTLVEFPRNMYETRLDHLAWLMDRDEVTLRQTGFLPGFVVDIGIDSLKRHAPTYTSVHPGQDSLNFVAPVATYNYSDKFLSADSVPFIKVADAYLFPDGGNVRIGQMASMERLKNSKLLANDISKRYFLYGANLMINSSKDYTGSGIYNYADEFENVYPIKFTRISVDTTLQTIASGTVAPADSFRLSPFFDFQGSVNLLAREPFMVFDGGVRVVHDCSISRNWLRFTSPIDPYHVRIPVEEQMKNVELNKIFAGSMITRDSTHIYPAFLSGRKDYFDSEITSAHGWLIYNRDKESYEIASEEKLADTTRSGNLLRFNPAGCRLYGEGQIDLRLDYGQVKMTTTGNAVHRIPEDRFETNLILGLDFFFSEEALNIMGQEIDSLPNLEPSDLSSHTYVLGMRDMLGMELAGKLERELGLYGLYSKIPPELEHTIFFNEIALEWNQDSRSFRYNGKVGIGNIGNIQVNKKVDAYIEFVEKGSGDIFDIYLKANDNTWYYIAYSPGGLQVLSSNRAFNQTVFDLKANDRKLKVKLGQPKYVYSLAADRRLELFILRFMDNEERKEEGPQEVY